MVWISHLEPLRRWSRQMTSFFLYNKTPPENVVLGTNFPVQQTIFLLSAVKSVKKLQVSRLTVFPLHEQDSSHKKKRDSDGAQGLTASVRLFLLPTIPSIPSQLLHPGGASARLQCVCTTCQMPLGHGSQRMQAISFPALVWLNLQCAGLSIAGGGLEPCWGWSRCLVALGDALSRCRHWGRELSLIRIPGGFCKSSIVNKPCSGEGGLGYGEEQRRPDRGEGVRSPGSVGGPGSHRTEAGIWIGLNNRDPGLCRAARR
ncbi:hypothetical protein B0T18DRAFT_99410 [Schizothecium vesticola]|uniref:Uncharacterized protein n=1 Tax=Schizothecium vesticola TaxID=314040 RepID=A0AA40K7T9_9PEZI|nr:hypothetical protein B0T18DRAFT_99410 [Schizothecium vesticola]